MAEVRLSSAKQVALRHLLASEPVPGRALPDEDLLQRLASLIPCDTVRIALIDPQGSMLEQVQLPRRHRSMLCHHDHHDSTGPPALGIVHRSHLTPVGDTAREDGPFDSLSLSFRNGRQDVVQLWFGRAGRRFGEHDIALLWTLAPALQRLVRDPAAPALPDELTLSERRTLSLLAAGFSNSEIAERMCVATSTVRKHLEHAYRKLGVTNRLAATTALRVDSRHQDSSARRLAAGR